ncbi:MAG: glycosyltransferase [Verrucomicrobia bacterium]|nr:glycosyltransferase [Verrucomicrobiota bacterium]
MKIVHVSSARGFYGGEGQVLALCTGLAGCGHDVLLVVPPGSALSERARAAGVVVHELRMRTEFDLFAAHSLRCLATEFGADVVHCHTGMAHGLGWLASGGARPWKLVVTRRVLRPIRRGLFTRLKYHRRVDAFIAISRATRRQLLRYGVAPNVISAACSACVEPEPTTTTVAVTAEQYGIGADEFVIGAIGQLDAYKDHRTLVAAAGLLRRRGREFRLLIVGDGRLRVELERQAESEGISDITTFTGYVVDIRPLLARADVLAMPSTQEALGTIVLRAFDTGVPVVAADAGGLPEIVRHGETGRVFRAGDPEALSRELELAMDDPSRLGLVDNARHLLDERFRPGHMVEANLDVYRRLIEAGGTGVPGPIEKRNGSRTLYVQPEWQARLAKGDLWTAVEHAPAAAGLTGRSDLRLVEINGARLLCKRMQHGGLLAKLLGDRYVDHRKPLSEMRVAAHALAHGVPTAELPAVLTERAAPPFYRYWVLSKEIAGCTNLLEYLRERRPRRERIAAVAAAARAVAAMHDAGLYHADLHLKNILVRFDASGEARAFIIDFDKAVLEPHMSMQRRFTNLRRLWKSAEKARAAGFAIARSDMVRFLVEYAGEDFICHRELARHASGMRWHRWRYRHDVLTTIPK